MKISLDLEPCCNKRSGIGNYTYEIAKRLQNIKDIEVEGNVFNFISRNNIEGYMDGLHIKRNLCTIFPYGLYRRIWNYTPIKYNWLFNDKSDIYHFFNFIVPPRVKGKVVTTVYDMTYKLYPETMNKRNLKRLEDDMEYSVRRADKIITITESSKNDIMKFLNVDASKIEVVYCGVDYYRFNMSYTEEQKINVRKKYNLPLNYILYMGTLEPRKNIESIIKAFELLRKQKDFDYIKLVIAGKKGWLFENIFNLVDKLNLKEHVIFTDYVDEEDKPLIYSMANLFVFPSLYEGFGIPVIEAMASSTPVITSNVSSLQEITGDAAVLVHPKDIEGISKYMKKILTDEGFKVNLITKGHIQSQKFTWEDAAKKIYEVYKSLLVL